MTSRVQNIRHTTKGTRPAVDSRQPGEFYTNFPDRQLGVINGTRQPVDLIAVRYHSTTTDYLAGDHVVHQGILYRALAPVPAGAFNPAQWSQGITLAEADARYIQQGAASDTYLAKAGGTMTGAITLPGNPSGNLHAVPKQYVDTMLPKTGGTMTGAITLPGDPVNPLEAAPKQYADRMLPKAGGTMTGAIVLPGAPVNPLDAVPKQYVDGGLALKIGDAPADGFQYGRQNNAWAQFTSISEAPQDGKRYYRQNGVWVADTAKRILQKQYDLSYTSYTRTSTIETVMSDPFTFSPVSPTSRVFAHVWCYARLIGSSLAVDDQAGSLTLRMFDGSTYSGGYGVTFGDVNRVTVAPNVMVYGYPAFQPMELGGFRCEVGGQYFGKIIAKLYGNPLYANLTLTTYTFVIMWEEWE